MKNKKSSVREENQNKAADNYKGVFFGDDSEKKFYEGGAHFNYKELCTRLNALSKTLSPRRVERSVSIKGNAKTLVKKSLEKNSNIITTTNNLNNIMNNPLKSIPNATILVTNNNNIQNVNINLNVNMINSRNNQDEKMAIQTIGTNKINSRNQMSNIKKTNTMTFSSIKPLNSNRTINENKTQTQAQTQNNFNSNKDVGKILFKKIEPVTIAKNKPIIREATLSAKRNNKIIINPLQSKIVAARPSFNLAQKINNIFKPQKEERLKIAEKYNSFVLSSIEKQNESMKFNTGSKGPNSDRNASMMEGEGRMESGSAIKSRNMKDSFIKNTLFNTERGNKLSAQKIMMTSSFIHTETCATKIKPGIKTDNNPNSHFNTNISNENFISNISNNNIKVASIRINPIEGKNMINNLNKLNIRSN
jgi:hypothetical protein